MARIACLGGGNGNRRDPYAPWPRHAGPVRTMLTGGMAIMLSLMLAACAGIRFSTHSVVSSTTIAGAITGARSRN
jgi:hypothetical protein